MQDAAAGGSPRLGGGASRWRPAGRLHRLLLGLRPGRPPAAPPVLRPHLLPGVRAEAGRARPRAALDPLPAVPPEHPHAPRRGGHAGPRPGRLPGHQGRAGAPPGWAPAPRAPQRRPRGHSAARRALPGPGPPAPLPPALLLLLLLWLRPALLGAPGQPWRL
ncbi:unnamed protein product, partial [Pipistrellus nathusii]